jgi:quinol monooxygenase YgiN
MPYDLPVVQDTSTVVELRQYTMQPGKRDALIDLFDRHFIAGQEASGMRVLGQFRDRGDPNRFVWMRGFRDMPSRAKSLQSFYGGPMWKEFRNEANATMVDASDVLLLRPVDSGSGFALPSQRIGVGARLTSLVVATIYLLQAPVDASFLRFFDAQVKPVMVEAGAPPVARFQTEYAENNFPALPVRTGEHAFVWFSSFANSDEYDRYLARLWDSSRWNGTVKPELEARLKSPVQQLVLQPTALSLVGSIPAAGGAETAALTGDVHDFDFLPGKWNIKNRRLKQRGVGSTDWDEFPAVSRGSIHMGGIVNIDENDFPTKGWSGMTIRTFDTAKKQWSIYWVNSRLGTMLPPVVGGFKGDHGVFVGEDDDEGRPVLVIFNWTKLGPDRAHWQQSFSYDGGKTWEVNWTMELARAR